MRGARAIARPGSARTKSARGASARTDSARAAARARIAPLLLVALVVAGGCADSASGVRGSDSGGLIFARGERDAADLFRARVADGAVARFVDTADVVETWPYWSPEGRRLVFQARRAGGSDNDLMIWEPDDPSPRPWTRTAERDERWPCWSPDGRRLVFAFRGGTPPAGLGWIEPDGETGLLAAAGLRDFYLRPEFSPDGTRVVAQRRDGDGRGSALWLIEAGGAARRLTPGSSGAGAAWNEQKARFEPDGGAVIYTRSQPGRPREIARVRLADGAIETLPLGAPDADDHSAHPSPTRDEIVFVSDRSGSRDVFLWSPGSGPPRNLTRTGDRDEMAPVWSPDGDRLVVTRAPPRAAGPDGEQLPWNELELVVIDREGRVLLETPGMMADWMPAF